MFLTIMPVKVIVSESGIKAYEENAPVDETIGLFLDERESLIIECKDADMAVEAGIPAVIGASDIDETVFEKFKNYIIRPNDIENITK